MALKHAATTLRLPSMDERPFACAPLRSFVLPHGRKLVSGRPSSFRPQEDRPGFWLRTAGASLAGAVACVATTLLVLAVVARMAGGAKVAASAAASATPARPLLADWRP